MSFVRFIIFLLGVFIVIFLVALLLPSKVTVSKSVEINASHDAVKNEIVDFDEWKKWYPAFKDETVTVAKNPAGQKVISSVTFKDYQGKAILLNLVDTSNNKISINVESASSTKVTYVFLLIPKQNNQIQLTWDVNVDLGWYPWKRIEGIFFDKFSGTQYESALEDLKSAAEN